ncbi:uncharacterized protein isoform X3 [Danio rerio]|uniref:Uncharacterized protein isoform X3 n=1 Tax=Danio rerio TaxID=7955 RepID=A0AC58JEY2_DANRE
MCCCRSKQLINIVMPPDGYSVNFPKNRSSLNKAVAYIVPLQCNLPLNGDHQKEDSMGQGEPLQQTWVNCKQVVPLYVMESHRIQCNTSSSKSPYPSTMEADMAEVACRLSQRCELHPRTQMEFRSFCVATLVWLHRLGHVSVMELKVREWLGRRPEGDAVILTPPSKAMSLSQKEEEWLECYFRHVRPLCLQAQASGTDDRGCFFLGATGLPLTNPIADIQRLKAKQVFLKERLLITILMTRCEMPPICKMTESLSMSGMLLRGGGKTAQSHIQS